MTLRLSVKISSPNKIIWEGLADSISSVNSQGPFDILPYHANFITIVENHSIIIIRDNDQKIYNFTRAIIFCSNDRVHIFTDI